MTANNNELLSALVDGELTGQELDQAIALLSTDSEARAQFQRYQRTSNALHGHGTTSWQTDISQKMRAALSDEPHHIKPATSTTASDNSIPKPTSTPEPDSDQAKVIPFPSQFWKQATGLAVAASFGALAVITTTAQPDLQPIPANPMTVAEAQPNPAQTQTVTVATTTPETGHRWTIEEQEVEDRLNVYLLDHNEYAGASDIFSNARVIAYDAGQ